MQPFYLLKTETTVRGSYLKSSEETQSNEIVVQKGLSKNDF